MPGNVGEDDDDNDNGWLHKFVLQKVCVIQYPDEHVVLLPLAGTGEHVNT